MDSKNRNNPLKIHCFQGVCLSCDNKREQERDKNLFSQNVIMNLQLSIIQWIVEISWCWDLEIETWSTDCYSQHLFSYVKFSLQNQIVLCDLVRWRIYGSEETGHFLVLQT